MKKHIVYRVNLRVDLHLWMPIIGLFTRIETSRYEDEWMGVGESGWERMGVGGSGWEWMGVGGSGWEWVGVNGSGWERVGAQIGKAHLSPKSTSYRFYYKGLQASL